AGAQRLGIGRAPLGDPGRRDRDPAGLVAALRGPKRREERRIRLDEEAFGRDQRDHPGGRFLAGPEGEPRDRDRQAEVEDGAGVVGRSREGMYDRRRTPTELCTRCPAAVAGGAELRDERVLSVPGAGPGADVEDDRLADPDAQLEMALEIRQLEGDRREDAVVVEAGLADR